MKSENKINTLPVLIIFINPFCRNMKLKLIDFGSGAFYQSGPFTDFDGKLHFIPAYCTFYMQLRFWPSSKQTFQCTLFKEEKNYLFVMQQMKKRFCLMVFCCCKNMTQNLLQLREQNLLACFFFFCSVL